jgi:hypothetical protein
MPAGHGHGVHFPDAGKQLPFQQSPLPWHCSSALQRRQAVVPPQSTSLSPPFRTLS